MHLTGRLLFAGMAAVAAGLFTRNIFRIRQNIRLGRDEDFSDRRGLRWKNLLLLAFGQKKMFRNPSVAILHAFIYFGFIIINIEVLEIMLDGLFGTHRLLAAPLGKLYPWLINAFEMLALTVLLACIVFLIRRNVTRVARLTSPDLDGWPKSDANYILIAEIVLMSLFLTMNAADTSLTQLRTGSTPGPFLVSGLGTAFFSGLPEGRLEFIERSCWWLHIAGIFAFLNYLPYSKHLHILLAFPNAYYARLKPKGMIRNMPAVQQEVLYAMRPELAPTEIAPPASFGARDIAGLSWRNLLDAYSCTECGRCTAACPASITGKKLSPRKIMMDTRDRATEVGEQIRKTGKTTPGKQLLGDYITAEELRACTSCQACVQECPVSIDPLEIIIELRRALIMEDSNAPQEWNTMFANIENNFAPWKFSPEERDGWAE